MQKEIICSFLNASHSQNILIPSQALSSPHGDPCYTMAESTSDPDIQLDPGAIGGLSNAESNALLDTVDSLRALGLKQIELPQIIASIIQDRYKQSPWC